MFKELMFQSLCRRDNCITVEKIKHCLPLRAIHQYYEYFGLNNLQPFLSISRKSGELVGNFNPTASILRMMRVRAQGKRPYYAEKKASKINAGKINSSKNMSESRGSVTAIVFVERKRQIAIATSDCILSFWNSRLQHLVDFVDTQIPQVRFTRNINFF